MYSSLPTWNYGKRNVLLKSFFFHRERMVRRKVTHTIDVFKIHRDIFGVCDIFR